MDVTTSKLLMLCYAFFAVVLCTVGYLFYQAQARSLTIPKIDIASNSATAKAVPAPGSQAVSRRLRFEIERQQKRIDELQQILDRRESILKLQASRLKNNTQEYQDLQQEADEYLDLLFDVIQSSAFRVHNLAHLDEQSTREPASGEEGGEEEAVDTLQIALEASQWELEQSIASATAVEATAAAAEQRLIVLQQAIIDLGEMSVPTLIGLLGDQEATVRAWAAATLGRMGNAATVAVDALGAATEDADSQVRAAASASIQEISASW